MSLSPTVEVATLLPSFTLISKFDAIGASFTGVILIVTDTIFPRTDPSKARYWKLSVVVSEPSCS